MTKEIIKIAVFKGRKIRKPLYKNEWWFSIVDIVEALTDSAKPRVYWNAMKTRVKGEAGIELSTICRQLKLESSDGKKYDTDCADTEGVFRIIQSIPSPKAEPFKPGWPRSAMNGCRKLKTRKASNCRALVRNEVSR